MPRTMSIARILGIFRCWSVRSSSAANLDFHSYILCVHHSGWFFQELCFLHFILLCVLFYYYFILFLIKIKSLCHNVYFVIFFFPFGRSLQINAAYCCAFEIMRIGPVFECFIHSHGFTDSCHCLGLLIDIPSRHSSISLSQVLYMTVVYKRVVCFGWLPCRI